MRLKMDGWIDGQMDGWVDGWVDGWTDRWIEFHFIVAVMLSLLVLF